MTDNKKRILEMLAEKKITVDEAERLLGLVESQGDDEAGVSEAAGVKKHSPKYLRVVVQPNAEGTPGSRTERVNIRVPMALIRAGIKLTSLIPASATNHVNATLREKGVDLDLSNIKADDIEQLVEALSDLEVDVQSNKEKVNIYVE